MQIASIAIVSAVVSAITAGIVSKVATTRKTGGSGRWLKALAARQCLKAP